jgi:hypothetical protein
MTQPKTEDRKPVEASEKMDLAPVAPDSFRRTGWIERWRFWGPVLLVAIFVLWRGVDAWVQELPGRTWHTPGQLATAHVYYDDQCSVCHEAFTPVSASNWLGDSLGRSHAGDAKCMECHENFNHSASENPDRRPSCTACHVEHRGRMHSLVHTPDGQCTMCHASLVKKLAHKAETQLANVSAFDKASHPDFRPAQDATADKRRLKFNHKLHLTPGFQRTQQGEAFTLEKVDPRYQSLYGSQANLNEAVHLQCKSCHQLDSRDFSPPADVFSDVPRNAVTPARPPGSTMLPIVYEQHCQGCHPLAFEATKAAGKGWQGVVAPHRQQPAEIRRFLAAYYLEQLRKTNPGAFQQPFPPLPGKSPSPEQQVLSSAINDRVERAEKQLYLGKKVCGECHYIDPAPERLASEKLVDLKIEPTQVPEVWFTRANFTHTPHRMLDCLACHAGADKRDELSAGTPPQRVGRLLPGIDNCLNCHNSSISGGGARQDCVACHRYHDGEHPLSGKGTAARAGAHAGKWSIREFIEAGEHPPGR